jgi:hypothetical protein
MLERYLFKNKILWDEVPTMVEIGIAINARESENYLPISCSFGASK